MEVNDLAFVDVSVALIVSFSFLGLLIYRRVNLGITLNATALFFAVLSLDLHTIPKLVYQTAADLLTIATVSATFVIMLLSQLYKETRIINDLSDSASGVVKNSKIVSSLLPAVIGLLPVAGGALMSAPLVDTEANKLGLKKEKKAYVNVWFRHTIFPVYPLSQVLIVTVALTGIAMPLIIARQIPVVLVMITVGYIIGFWKVSAREKKQKSDVSNDQDKDVHLKRFLVAFSPILATIIIVIALNMLGLGLGGIGFDVFIATIAGLVVLIWIAKPKLEVLTRPIRSPEIYGVTLAAYGAFLLKNVAIAAGISELVKGVALNSGVDLILLLTIVPTLLGFATGSPSGGVAISVSVLAGLLTFSAKTAALLYMSAYLGYLIVPSHLCFAFTADYFKCSMGNIYRYLIPSFLLTFAAAVLIYLLV